MGGRDSVSDPFDKLLFPEGIEEEDEEKRIRYLKCARCTINIGPGYLRREVWYDTKLKRPVCKECGERSQTAHKVVSEKELLESTGGADLIKLINARKKK